ncbi:hypothetical protein Tco_0325325 [Tanacetum coccineum]
MTRTCKIKTIRKEFIEIESLKSSIQHSSVNDVFVLNKSEEDVEIQQRIILDHGDQLMWESANTVALVCDVYSQKDKNEAKTDKIEHEIEKSKKSRS